MADLELHDRPESLIASPGDRITVHLPENPTTGYRWTASTHGEAIKIESSDTQPGLAERPGAAGERLIVLRAVRPGASEAEFVLARRWQPESPADLWRLAITVEPQTVD
jgi:inhibitor of cysteine peptidase